eukprot:scaffold61229_cov60-Phaeocystis_antarctica.AAC.1
MPWTSACTEKARAVSAGQQEEICQLAQAGRGWRLAEAGGRTALDQALARRAEGRTVRRRAHAARVTHQPDGTRSGWLFFHTGQHPAVVEEAECRALLRGLGEEACCEGRVRGPAWDRALVVADAQLAQADRGARLGGRSVGRSAHLGRGGDQRHSDGLVLRHSGGLAAAHAAAERGERVEVALRGRRGVPVGRVPRVGLAAAHASEEQQAERVLRARVAGEGRLFGLGVPVGVDVGAEDELALRRQRRQRRQRRRIALRRIALRRIALRRRQSDRRESARHCEGGVLRLEPLVLGHAERGARVTSRSGEQVGGRQVQRGAPLHEQRGGQHAQPSSEHAAVEFEAAGGT